MIGDSLGDEDQPGPHRGPRVPGRERLAEHPDRAAPADEACDGGDQARLPVAVGADDRDALTGADGERHRLDGHELAVADGDALDLQCDRCDRCGAQAYVVIEVSGVELLFCGHHFNTHCMTIIERGYAIVADEREQLLERY